MSIEIKIPEYAKKWNDWSDHELVVLSFLNFCYKQKDITVKTEFYLHYTDMMSMLNRYGSKNGIGDCLAKLRRVYRIGQTNNYTLQVSLSDGFRNATKHSGKIITDSEWISESTAIAIWFYLAGRCTDSDIFEDPKPWQTKGRARHFYWLAPAVI